MESDEGVGFGEVILRILWRSSAPSAAVNTLLDLMRSDATSDLARCHCALGILALAFLAKAHIVREDVA